MAARLIALAFLLQAIGLFVAPRASYPLAAPAHGANLAASLGANLAAAPHCPHHAPSQSDGDQGSSCPMCQALGCALAGAAAPAPVIALAAAEIGVLAPPSSQPAPKMAPRRTVSARAPPLTA